MNELIARLKQRKLVQWALAYVAFAFALLQGMDVVAHQFGWPDGLQRGITLALVVGLPVVLVLVAWYHGERGAQKVSGTEIVILALLLAIGGGLLRGYERLGLRAPRSHSAARAPRRVRRRDRRLHQPWRFLPNPSRYCRSST